MNETGTATFLTEGAKVILGQMILQLAYCLGCVIFHFVFQFKTKNAKKEVVNKVKAVGQEVIKAVQEQAEVQK
jgi:ribosomal protein S26